MTSLKIVSKEEAKSLGMTVRANAAGPELVRVELAFDVKGALKDFLRVDLLIDGGKLAHVSLLPDPSAPGSVMVGFAADRARLGLFALRVVTRTPVNRMVGYELRVNEFVDLAKVK